MGCKPEFGFTISVRYVHMNARFFARKEEKAKLTVANNGWSHFGNLTIFLPDRLRFEVSRALQNAALGGKRKMSHRSKVDSQCDIP